jgi:mono/diheme cytochrome c family protein
MVGMRIAGGLLLVLLPAVQAGAAPMVPGFERFARHTQETDGGEVLLTELSCTACHLSGLPTFEPKGGPDLSGVGRAIDAGWMRQFLLDPQAVKPGTTMPALLTAMSDAERSQCVDALVVFLKTQQRDFPELKSTASAPVAVEFWNKGDANRGRSLYHTVGCVACHAADADYETGEAPPSSLESLLQELDEDELKQLGLTDSARPVPSVPLPRLAEKYSRKALAHFLLNPALSRPAGRMPSLKLSPAEAADIAAWLLRDERRDAAATVADQTAKLVADGKRLFGELGCSNCHSADGIAEKKPAKPLAELNGEAASSCIRSPGRNQPDFSLDDDQQGALRSAIQRDGAGRSDVEHAGESVTFRMRQLNCFACHERDGRGGAGPKRRAYFEIEGHIDLGDEGRIPPPLTGVGRKFKATWLNKVLGGTGDVRPHMLVRMPVFPDAVAGLLPAGFARADELIARPDDAVFGETSSLVAAGRELLDTGCVQCHPVRGERLPGVVGIDLDGVAARVEPQWFLDFLRNPAALKNRTRMPTFFPNGRSANQTLLDGDVDRQIAAMWAYIKDAARQPLPQKIEQGKVHNFELVPTDRPVILRTFLRDAGPHGIAVGFPQKIHLAFDAEQVRLAEFWKGRFLDAHGTWFDRFTPLAAPLGNEVVSLPGGVPFATVGPDAVWPQAAGEEGGYQFRGYRLDRSGTPEFLYRVAGFSVSDRIAPASDSGFNRRITLRPDGDTSASEQLWFRVLAGKSLKRQSETTMRDDAGLSAEVSDVLAGRAVLVEGRGGSASETVREWRIPIEAVRDMPSKATVIEVRYVW